MLNGFAASSGETVDAEVSTVQSSSKEGSAQNAASVLSLTTSAVSARAGVVYKCLFRSGYWLKNLRCALQILNHKHSASRTGIPFGALVTPLPDLRAPLPVIRRLPVACPSCCAVINTYCKASLQNPSTWGRQSILAAFCLRKAEVFAHKA